MNTKGLTAIAKEHNATIVSVEPFLAIVEAKNETHKVYENGVEKIETVVSDEKKFDDELAFRNYCREEVYADIYRTVHDGWN